VKHGLGEIQLVTEKQKKKNGEKWRMDCCIAPCFGFFISMTWRGTNLKLDSSLQNLASLSILGTLGRRV